MPHVSAHDAVLYAANDLITALTRPQLPKSGISFGDDQIGALRKLATIFQCATKTQPIAEPGEPDRPPLPRPRTRSQTKALANAAIRVPLGPHVRQPPPPPPPPQLIDDPKHDEDISLNDVAYSPNHDIRTQTQGTNSSINNSSIIQIMPSAARGSAPVPMSSDA